MRDELIAKLVADLQTACDEEAVAACEACGAPLFTNDDFVTGDDVSGCWAAMTDAPSRRERPCYAYRLGKASANDTAQAGHRQ